MIFKWVALETELLDLPEMAECGPLGFALYCAALQYSARVGTGGFVPTSKLNSLLDFGSVRTVGADNPTGRCDRDGDDVHSHDGRAIADALVQIGAFESAVGGIRIPRYHRYNQSAEQLEAAKRKQSEGGKLGAAKRWSKPTTASIAATMPAGRMSTWGQRDQKDSAAGEHRVASAAKVAPQKDTAVHQMYDIWNAEKHRSQDRVTPISARSGGAIYSACADLLAEIDGDLNLFAAMVRSYAASPHHNGTTFGPYQLRTMVSEDKRGMWIERGLALLAKNETLPDAPVVDEEEAIADQEAYMRYQEEQKKHHQGEPR